MSIQHLPTAFAVIFATSDPKKSARSSAIYNICVCSIVRMARWPNTHVELEKCTGADDVRSIRRERELCCLVCSAGTFIGRVDNVKSE